MDDAFAAPPGSVELQGAARYDRRRRGEDSVRLSPRLQIGVLEGLQAAISLPYTVGDGPRADQGDATLDLLYNLNRERPWLPAFAVSIDASTPVGPGDRGPELRLTGIATRTVDPAAGRRLHLNLSWFRRLDPAAEDRRDRYGAVLGYSQRLTERTVLVLDYLRQSQERGERDANILEAGLRHEPRPGLVLGGALGAGLGRDSPRFRAVLSVQFMLAGG